MSNESPALVALRAEYAELCAKRDETNVLNTPLEIELAALHDQIQPLQARTREVAAQIDANRAAAGHRETKKRIGKLATAIMELKRAA